MNWAKLRVKSDVRCAAVHEHPGHVNGQFWPRLSLFDCPCFFMPNSTAPLTPAQYLTKILNARVYEVAQETPLDAAPRLGQRLGCTVLLKREDQQPVFSFKLRGAYNKMAHLGREQLERGVICASAGNHAQGVALSAKKLGCRAVIVMPTTTPQVKVDAVAALGGEVVLAGDSYSDAYAHAVKIQAEQELTFIHPFDDPEVIAGQGTVAMEMFGQLQKQLGSANLDAVFVPIGGGGLAAGMAAYIKAVRPAVKVIGVQMVDSDAMVQSVRQNARVQLTDVGLFSDGTAVKLVGQETFRLCHTLLDGYVRVDTDAVCAAIRDVFADTRSIVEPAGALAVAGLVRWVGEQVREHGRHVVRGRTFAAVLSGANMNFDRLRFVAERAAVGDAREALLAVTIPEERGSFRRFCEAIAQLPQGASRSVTEFNYRIRDAGPKSSRAHIFVGLSTAAAGESMEMAEFFKRQGFEALDLTFDELAKEHLRHMVGGRSDEAHDERLLRFEFPERPGALLKFLSLMQPTWNISLFHYRNQGADYGRILVGIQVPETDNEKFAVFLNQLGYPWVEETANPAYRLFLR